MNNQIGLASGTGTPVPRSYLANPHPLGQPVMPEHSGAQFATPQVQQRLAARRASSG